MLPTLLATGTIVFAIGATQIQSDSTTVVSDSYIAPGLGEVRIKGICDLQEASVVCWDWNRKPSKELADEVTNICGEKGRSFGGGAQDILIRFRRKNRVAIVDGPTLANSAAAEVRLQGFEGPGGSTVQDLHQYSGGRDTRIDHLLNFNVDPKAKNASLYATLLSKVGRTTEVPATVGESVTIGGRTVKI
jgi:hypothetical protein